jgi:predicted Zn-dependent protease
LRPKIAVVHFRGLCVVLSLIFAPCLPSARAAEKSLIQLEREAKEVLSDPDNVSRAARIAPVFALAAMYVAIGETNKAITYYSKALEHEPWNLEGQLALAECLNGTGQTNSAREKASLVFSRAEKDAVLARAARLLGTNFSTTLPDSEPWPANTYALALVPVGEVDAWLMQAVRQDLQGMLHIPVIIQRVPLTLPTPGRDPLHAKATDLRERIVKAQATPAFRDSLRRHKLSTNGLQRDERVFVLAEKVLETESDKEQLRRFREELAFLRRLGPQWDAAKLLSELKQGFATVDGSPRGVLGITQLDLYSNENRYLFGLAEIGANRGILSYWRFRGVLADEPPNRDRLRERTLKQALSSTGLLFGLPRCTNPTCARAYANSLTEHDAKQAKLCAACEDAFARRFGK